MITINYADWKDIIGYEGLYKISNKGKIYNCNKNKLVTQRKTERGFTVTLYKDNKRKTFSVPRLVAIHFVPNPYNYNKIYFIDGNKYNVNSYNIQWNFTNKDTKIVVDGVVFNSINEYKKFCDNNRKAQRIMELNDICDIQIPKPKVIKPIFKF